MALYREQAVVLRTHKLGETDRIVSLLTAGRGKVRAVVKGVRRPGSKFGGRTEPFSHVDLQLYEGRNLDIVTQAELKTSFTAVREEYALSACGATMTEAADRIALQDERSLPLYALLLEGLRALDARPATPESVLDAYLLRLASVAGYHPYLGACAACGAPGDHLVLSFEAGGVLCGSCAPPDAFALAPDVRVLLDGFLTGGPSGCGALQADARVRRTAGRVVNGFLTYHLGSPLRAWEMVPR